jgi:O-antigen/teichoic acid export membrane protein
MTDPGQSRHLLRNMLYGFSTWILPLFLGLVATRVIVRSLGHSDYGIYALVLGFVAYSFNFSIGRAITKYLATYRATGETQKIRSVISATALVTSLVAVVGFGTIFAISHWLVTTVFENEIAARYKAQTALRVAAATIFILMLTQIATAVLQGLHRFDVFSKIQNANSIVMIIGNLWLAYNGYGLVVLLYWNLTVAVATCLIAFISAKKLLPELTIGADFTVDAAKMVIRYSSGVLGYQVAANVFFIFERSWIIAKLGAEALTFYVVPMTVGIYMHGFVASLAMVLFPLASELDHDRERLLKLYCAATKSVIFVVVIISTTLIVEGKLFLTLWMGPDFGERSAQILTMHTIAFGMAAITIVSFQTAEGLGRPGFNFRNTLIGVLVALPLVVWLTAQNGSIGVAAGRIVVFAVPFAAIFDLEHRHLGGIQDRFWIGNVARFGAAALSAAIVETVVSSFAQPSWPTFIVTVISGCLVYSLTAWLFGVASDEDRRMIKRVIRREV